MQIDYSRLPEHMRDGARRYIEQGVPGGSFLTAVFSNSLIGAFGRADDTNADAMRDWAAFLLWNAPIGCHGSPELVQEWIAHGGLLGLEAA